MIDLIIYLVLISFVVFFYFKYKKVSSSLLKETVGHIYTKSLLQQSETKREYFKNLAFKRNGINKKSN